MADELQVESGSSDPAADGRSSPESVTSTTSTFTELTTLAPLLLILGDAVVEEYNELCLMGTINESAWKEMQKSASRVHSIALSNKVPMGQRRVNELTYFRLAQLQGASSPLFPSLSALILNTSSYSYLPLFLSPSLTSVTLTALGDDNRAFAANAFLTMLGDQGELKQLSLDSFKISPASLNLKAVMANQKLESVTLTKATGVPDLSLLLVLSSLPQLESLTFHSLQDESTFPYRPTPNSTQLPFQGQNITSLDISGQLSMVLEWLSILILGSCGLQNLRVILSRTAVISQRGSRLQLSHKRISSQEIEALLHDQVSRWEKSLISLLLAVDHPMELPVRSTAFDTLSQFSKLRTLEISGILFANINEDLERCIPQWTAMEDFRMPMVQHGIEICILTIDTLALLSQHCPSLTYIQAVLQEPRYNPFKILDSAGHHFLNVQTLSTASLTVVAFNDPPFRIQKCCEVVQDLFKVFPSLERLQIQSQARSSDDSDDWADIHSVAEMFRKLA